MDSYEIVTQGARQAPSQAAWGATGSEFESPTPTNEINGLRLCNDASVEFRVGKPPPPQGT